MRVTVDLPGLRTRRASIKFSGIRPRIRRAAVNADIIFAVAHRACSLDVSMKAEDEHGHRQMYQLTLQDLPHAAMAPPSSYYEVLGLPVKIIFDQLILNSFKCLLKYRLYVCRSKHCNVIYNCFFFFLNSDTWGDYYLIFV